MNINLIDYPLERFMIWLTGNDHSISVVIDDVIASAIKKADPDMKIARVAAFPDGLTLVYWSDYVERNPKPKPSMHILMTEFLAAINSNDLVKAKQIQKQMNEE